MKNAKNSLLSFSKKAGAILTASVVAILLVSSFQFLLTQSLTSPVGQNNSDQKLALDSAVHATHESYSWETSDVGEGSVENRLKKLYINGPGSDRYEYCGLEGDRQNGQIRFRRGCDGSTASIVFDEGNPSQGRRVTREMFGEWPSTRSGHPVRIQNAQLFNENFQTNRENAPGFSGNPGEESDEAGAECDGAGAFNWIFCGMFELLADGIKFVEHELIVPLLDVRPLRTDGALFDVWSNIRNLANAGFVIVFLVLIFSQAMSLNLDAYTVKKALPRLAVAVIGVQISFYVAGFLVDVFNILGAGAQGLMLAPVENFSGSIIIDIDGFLANFLGVSGGLLGLAALGAHIFYIIPALMYAILAVTVMWLVLIFRQVLIALLVVLSPLAFVAFVLPNTERIFNTWSDFFIKALAMYPLMVALISSGKLAGIVAAGAFGNEGILAALASIAATFAPLFLLPITFKLGGAAVSVVAGSIQSFRKSQEHKKDGSGIMDRAQDTARRRTMEARSGNLTGTRTGLNIRNNLARGVTNPAGMIPRQVPLAGRLGSSARGRADTAFLGAVDQEEEQMEHLKGSPDSLRALARAGNTHGQFNRYIQQQIDDGEISPQEANTIANDVRSKVGSAEAQAASLRLLADIGKAEVEDFTATGDYLGNNPTAQAHILGGAQFKSRQNGRPDVGPGVFSRNNDGSINYRPEKVVDNAKGMSIENWEELKPAAAQAMASALSKASLTDSKALEALANVNSTKSELSPQKRAHIQEAVDRLPQDLRTQLEKIQGPEEAPKRTGGPSPGRDEGYL